MKAFFFDMDGVLFDSMPHHAQAWEEVMSSHGLHFTIADCYINEGRTGQDVIHEAILNECHREASEQEIWSIYREKTDAFHAKGPVSPMAGVKQVLDYLHAHGAVIFIVTGSGQKTLFDTIENAFPGIFTRERMITAYDVVHGKPNPEPYLKAWEKSGLPKSECCVVENAPLGIRAGKAAGLCSVAVNTGPLPDSSLTAEGADYVFPNMPTLLTWIKTLI